MKPCIYPPTNGAGTNSFVNFVGHYTATMVYKDTHAHHRKDIVRVRRADSTENAHGKKKTYLEEN